MELYLIRHANTLHGREHYNASIRAVDPPLSALGWEQAEKLGRRLEGTAFDAVYCSDLQRAVCTARLLCSYAGGEPIVEPSLREIDMGELQVKPWEAFGDLHSVWSRHESDIAYPGGENGEAAFLRCRPVLERIVQGDGERVALVIHGGTIRCILAGLLGIPFHRRFYLGAPLENCSITKLAYRREDGKFYLLGFNDAAHVDGSLTG